jgi:beta-1,4-mannosyl-glycoprotein beta-1,4-N-acetylglucosaminyltransferase
MTYDCFPFFNELDILEIRLHELSPVVDHFVIVESTRTHSNKPKALYFEENKDRFREFLPKIIHIIVSDFPDTSDRWELDNFQRNAISRGLVNCKSNDVIIISDADEIISANIIEKYKDHKGVKILEQNMYYYFVNCKVTDYYWRHAKMVHYKNFSSPQLLRNYPYPLRQQKNKRFHIMYGLLKHRLKRFFGIDIIIKNSGWHFSYMGDVEFIQSKIHSFCHSEFDNNSFTNIENIQRAISNGEDVFRREGMKFEFVKFDNSFPQYLIDEKDKFSSIIR